MPRVNATKAPEAKGRRLATEAKPEPASGPQLPSTYGDLLVLQRTVGNRSVGRLFASGKNAVEEDSSPKGWPLDTSTRSFMEFRLGQDFGAVRVHSDTAAAQRLEAWQAQAATVEDDIYLAPEHQVLGTRAGRAVLAHELAHVVQHRRQERGVQAGEAALEAEANLAAVQVAAGRTAQVQLAADRPVLKLGRAAKVALFAAGGLALAAGGLGIAALTGAALSAGVVTGALGAGAAIGTFFGLATTEPGLVESTDKYIRGHFGKDLASAIAQGISLGNSIIHVVGNDQFRDAYIETGGDLKDFDSVMAFTDRRKKPAVVWIREIAFNSRVTVHEALHVYSHINWLKWANTAINEGTTEYFAREIDKEQNLGISRAYDDEYQQVAALVEALAPQGEELFRQAYFEGKWQALQPAVDARFCSRGAFAQWIVAMFRKDWAAAGKIVAQGKQAKPCSLASITPPALGESASEKEVEEIEKKYRQQGTGTPRP
jgi:hypothetical protein